MHETMNHTRLGISTFSYPYAVGMDGFEPEEKADAFDLVDKAVKLRVPVLQIADNYPLHLFTEPELEELDRYAMERQITLEIGTRGICPEHLSAYVQIAEKLHAGLLRVVIDSKGDEPSADESAIRIQRILPALKEKNIILGIENHDRFSSHIFAEIVRKLDSPYVGIVLDTVNSFACEENTEQVLDELASYTVNFHMKDFRIDRIPNAMGLLVTGTIAGEGRLNFPKTMKRLQREAKTDFSTIIELWMQPEKSVEETLEKENCWVEQSVANMKRMLGENRWFLK